MVKKQTSPDTIPPSMKLPVLKVSSKEASTLLNSRLISGKRILKKLWDTSPAMVYMASQELNRWDRYNFTLLQGMFTTPSFAAKYQSCELPLDSIEAGQLQSGLFLRVWLSRKQAELQSIKDRLPLFDVAAKSNVAKAGMAKTFGNKVFVVHGHDKASKESVARFLECLGLNVVILHERPNKGRTIIEKLLEESDIDVGYAVVLLTPDDVGKLASADGAASPRARQNVNFELGLFVAKLGRQRVHALYREGVEIPTDYQGVLYTPLDDAGAWQVRLAMELKAVGFEIDLNKLIMRD
jgi:predicted nucleotide-binding protein